MSGISDNIERFILSLLSDQDEAIELQRNELAQHFRCAPSQINYVLSTRFTVARGYVIESRRGGNGYIRIVRVPSEMGDLSKIVTVQLSGEIDEASAYGLLEQLLRAEVITARECRLLAATVSENALKPFPARDVLRAGMLRGALTALMLNQEEDAR